MSFTNFLKRNRAFFKLAILNNLEYRFNFLMDAIFQPIGSALIELTLWYAVFASINKTSFGGFSLESYLAYGFWAPFIARISANWMYETRMINEIESGSINSILVRPITFFEYYLSQLMGYKFITTVVSWIIPLFMVHFFFVKFNWGRVPITLILVFYYLIFVYMLSFFVSCWAFHLNRIHSITVAKNLALWLLSGELIPLDLIPAPYAQWLIQLPFANATYIPVAYITGRIDLNIVLWGFASISLGIFILGIINYILWNWSVRKYVGTGA